MDAAAIEAKALELSGTMCASLDRALLSIGGRKPKGGAEYYLFVSARFISRVTHGYISLRTSDNRFASKVLVRPLLEAMYRFRAVTKEPSLVYRIAYTEYDEDLKLAQPYAAQTKDTSGLEAIRKYWDLAEPQLRAQFAGIELVQQSLSAFEAATKSGLQKSYDSDYRYYCRFTHGNFRAIDDQLNRSDHLDSTLFVLAMFVALEGLATIGAECGNTEDYYRVWMPLQSEMVKLADANA
jgi:hypothetical protein